jgi:hypothetical protein
MFNNLFDSLFCVGSSPFLHQFPFADSIFIKCIYSEIIGFKPVQTMDIQHICIKYLVVFIVILKTTRT